MKKNTLFLFSAFLSLFIIQPILGKTVELFEDISNDTENNNRCSSSVTSLEVLNFATIEVVINEIITDPQTDWSTTGFDGANAGGTISNGVDEAIELYIKTPGINLTGWTIELLDGSDVIGDLTDTGAFSVSNYLSSGSGTFTNTEIGDFLVLGNVDGSSAMNNSITINLKDSNGTLIDTVTLGGGVSNAASGNAASIGDEAVYRVPNGSDTNVDNEDFTMGIASLGVANPLSSSWSGKTNTNWATPKNWASGVLPSATDDVVIPNVANKPIIDASTIATAKNLAINEFSSLTVAAGGALTVSGSFSSLEDHALVLNSGSSILINSASTNKITYNRNIATTNWYLASSPVLEETIENVIANNTFAIGAGTNIGIGGYTNNTGPAFPWVYAEATTSGYSSPPGLGVSLKFASAGISKVEGLLSTVSVALPITIGSRNSFNLIGNPFAAYLNLGDFFSDNPITTVLSESSAYFWDGTSYQTKTSLLDGSFEIAPTQGFFVSSGQPVTVATFDIGDVSHQSIDTFLRGRDTREQIKLFISDGDHNSRYARIFYINGTTTGFDNGYDGSMFGGASQSLAVYSHLLSENQGVKFAVQSLPDSNHENMVVPIGVTAAAGEEITFSTEALNLPEGIKVFLEDRNTNTFTRLDETGALYKVRLTEAINDVVRFYLHTAQNVLSTDASETLNNISIFTSNSSTLKITGVQGRAIVKLFTVLGVQVINSSFTATGANEISLPNLSKGVYIVALQTEDGRLNKKIILE